MKNMYINCFITLLYFINNGFCADTFYVIETKGDPPLQAESTARTAVKLVNREGLSFIVHIPGLSNTTASVSFESGRKPGVYLSVSKKRRISLLSSGESPTEFFRQSATFKVLGGKIMEGFSSFESLQYPKHYIGGYKNRLFLVAKSWLGGDPRIATKFMVKPVTNAIKYDWSECSETCGNGMSTGTAINCPSSRTCVKRYRKCNEEECSQNEPQTYSWSECTEECGGGERFGTPNNCADPTKCSKKTESCNTHACEENVKPYVWSKCSRTCGGGTRYMYTDCNGQIKSECKKKYEECATQSCPEVSECPTNEEFRYKDKSSCCKKETDPTCGTTVPGFGPRIIGGHRAEPSKWPWMGLMEVIESNGDIYGCGATLISKDWAVTAAHCLRRRNGSEIRLTFGTTDIINKSPETQVVYVEKAIAHARYYDLMNDIALLKFNHSVNITSAVRPLCLPGGEKIPADGLCFAVGWGVASIEDLFTLTGSDHLNEVGLRNLDGDICRDKYRGSGYAGHISKDTLCVGMVSGKADTCLGDSGGPLMCQRCSSCSWYLAGITSFGPDKCGRGLAPGVFTNVLEYEDWIDSHINSGQNLTKHSTCK